MTAFDLNTKPLYAGVGATDLVVERVRTLVTEAQKRGQQRFAEVSKSVRELDLEPTALRDQAVKEVTTRVESLAADAKASRTSLEQRLGTIQSDVLALPARVQALLDENVAAAGGTYDELATRGEGLVTRIRRQEATQSTVTAAKTTATKAKTTKTQATKAASGTATAAKKSTTSTKKAAAKKSAPAKSSAKATATGAKKTASSAARAVGDAASKVGD